MDVTEIFYPSKQGYCVAHKTPQACKPKAVAMAVNNVMVIFKILLQIVLLSSFSIVLRFMISDVFVIQSVAKNLECIHVYVPEILPPYGRLDDNKELKIICVNLCNPW